MQRCADAGMPDVPEGFSVALVLKSSLARSWPRSRAHPCLRSRHHAPAWQEAMTASGPRSPTAALGGLLLHAWDFHLPPERADRFQLIECNDNGSGMMFAAILNRLYYELSGVGECCALETPPSVPAFGGRVRGMIDGSSGPLRPALAGSRADPRRRGVPERGQVQA